MVRSSLLIVAVGLMASSFGCGAQTASQERDTELPLRVAAAVRQPADSAGTSALVVVPANPIDKTIRRDLNLAISNDADLKNRRISFMVANGDVSVSGTVGTEQERRRINDLAMNVPGVKSVANALLIAR